MFCYWSCLLVWVIYSYINLGLFHKVFPVCLRFGILERCKELVEAGYDVTLPDKENVTLLHWAAINNRTELVK